MIQLAMIQVLFWVLISGCIHIEKYPETWDRLETTLHSTECPRLTNRYLNQGEKPNGTKVFLAAWLAPKTKSATPEERTSQRKMMSDLFSAQYVDLNLIRDEVFTVKATGNGIDRLWSFEKSKGQFDCKEGMLRIPEGENMSGDNVVAFGSGASDLYLSGKHLVINSHGGTAGIMLLIPAVGYGSDWARFESEMR